MFLALVCLSELALAPPFFLFLLLLFLFLLFLSR